MDFYVSDDPFVEDSNKLLNKIGGLKIGALASLMAWLRQKLDDADDAFPVVFAQETEHNQAMCSLMSIVLLRKVAEQYSGNRWRSGPIGAHQIRESVQVEDERGGEVPLTWHLPEIGIFSKTSCEFIHAPTVFVVHDETVPSGRSSLASFICDAVACRGWIAAEFLLHNDTSLPQTSTSHAMLQLSLRLAPGAPLFLVGDESFINDSLMSVTNAESEPKMSLERVSGIVVLASAQDECAAGGSNTRNVAMSMTMDVPFLLLDVHGNNNTMKALRYNPNVIAVQQHGERITPYNKNIWLSNCVLHFVDATIRLRRSWSDAHRLRSHL